MGASYPLTDSDGRSSLIIRIVRGFQKAGPEHVNSLKSDVPLSGTGERLSEDVRGLIFSFAVHESDLLIGSEDFGEPVSIHTMGPINVAQGGVAAVTNNLDGGLIVLLEVEDYLLI